MEKPLLNAGVRLYVIGFVSAVLLTLTAYFIVVDHWLSGVAAIATISLLAVVQFVVQLYFFLHLGKGINARWNVAAFAFMLMTLFILVAGSLWIMYNLNYNMMTPGQMNSYMQQQSKEGF